MGIIMVYNWKINVVRRRYVTGDLTGGKKIEGCDNYIINEGLQVRGVQKNCVWLHGASGVSSQASGFCPLPAQRAKEVPWLVHHTSSLPKRQAGRLVFFALWEVLEVGELRTDHSFFKEGEFWEMKLFLTSIKHRTWKVDSTCSIFPAIFAVHEFFFRKLPSPPQMNRPSIMSKVLQCQKQSLFFHLKCNCSYLWTLNKPIKAKRMIPKQRARNWEPTPVTQHMSLVIKQHPSYRALPMYIKHAHEGHHQDEHTQHEELRANT